MPCMPAAGQARECTRPKCGWTRMDLRRGTTHPRPHARSAGSRRGCACAGRDSRGKRGAGCEARYAATARATLPGWWRTLKRPAGARGQGPANTGAVRTGRACRFRHTCMRPAWADVGRGQAGCAHPRGPGMQSFGQTRRRARRGRPAAAGGGRGARARLRGPGVQRLEARRGRLEAEQHAVHGGQHHLGAPIAVQVVRQHRRVRRLAHIYRVRAAWREAPRSSRG